MRTVATPVKLSKVFVNRFPGQTCPVCTATFKVGEELQFVLKKWTRGGYKKQILVHADCVDELEKDNG